MRVRVRVRVRAPEEDRACPLGLGLALGLGLGPPWKIVPLLRTMTFSSAIAGTYAPPAVHEPR